MKQTVRGVRSIVKKDRGPFLYWATNERGLHQYPSFPFTFVRPWTTAGVVQCTGTVCVSGRMSHFGLGCVVTGYSLVREWMGWQVPAPFAHLTVSFNPAEYHATDDERGKLAQILANICHVEKTSVRALLFSACAAGAPLLLPSSGASR